MIRVIHISDFHLESTILLDWETYTKKALIDTIKGQEAQCPLTDTFVICSGDMINKAGKSFGGVQIALNKFKEKVIQPILDDTGISLDHFILLPGNHEVDRGADEDTHAEGLRSMIEKNGVAKINDYTNKILAGEYKDSERIKTYNAFIEELYRGLDNIKISPLGVTYNFETSEGTLGIAAFNTVWNAYDDEDFNRGLAIGEPQYEFCKKNIEKCEIKIAAMHHPLEWMKFEKKTVQNWIYSDFQFLYEGHVHETDSFYKSTVSGSLLVNVAPSYTSDIRSEICGAFSNGFSIIDYTHDNREFECRYYKYSLKERKYLPNTDICERGIYGDVLPTPVPSSLKEIQRHALDFISAVQFAEFDGSIIPMKAHAINTLKEAFVMPPVRKHADSEKRDYGLGELLLSKSHILLFGTSESGKTVMLQRLLMESVDEFAKYQAIPVFLDFNTIGTSRIESVIKQFIDANSAQTQELIGNGRILLFVDNYNPKQETRYIAHNLYNFASQHNVKIIASADCQSEGVLPLGILNDVNEIAFEYYFISRFSSEKVKQMMVRWSPKDEFMEQNAKLEKMVSRFCNYSLPCTAMSVSLYLWSTEKADREPVNEAVLLDIYIEIILEKLNLYNVYQNSFDYRNKTMLLAYLAEKIKEKYPVNLTYGEYIDIISGYMRDVFGFEKFDSKIIGDYFIDRKLFLRSGDEVYFAHSCFYHFFLAQRMRDSVDFHDKIISVDNYYRNDRAVSYFAGLVRNDKELLEFLLKDVEQYFEPAQQIYSNVNVDDCFTYLYVGEKKFLPIARSGITKKILEHKPNEEEIEKKLIQRCDEKLSKISDEIRSHEHKTPDLLISLLADSLKNLDGIEDIQLKERVYETIIRDSIIFTVVTKEALANYANKNKGRLPLAFADVKNVPFFFRFMPLAFQEYLSTLLGTTKLTAVFKKKFNTDMNRDCSDIERFLSVGILWDCVHLGCSEEMKRLIKKVKNNVTKDYILVKVVEHYNNKVISGSDEEKQYIKLFAALEVKDKFLSLVEQKRIEQKLMPKGKTEEGKV